MTKQGLYTNLWESGYNACVQEVGRWIGQLAQSSDSRDSVPVHVAAVGAGGGH